jgi:hypothetical protein
MILGYIFAITRNKLDILPYNRMPLDIDVVLIAIFFMAIGKQMKSRLFEERRNVRIILGCSLVGFIPTVILNGTVNLHGLTFNNLVLYIVEAISGSLIVMCFCILLQGWHATAFILVKNVLSWIGRNSIIILGLQAIMIRVYLLILSSLCGVEYELYCLTGIQQFISFGFVLITSLVSTYCYLLITKNIKGRRNE